MKYKAITGGLLLCAASTLFIVAQTPASQPNPAGTALNLEQQGKNSEAASAWKQVIEAQPGNAQAYAHLGLIEARLEHYPEAIASYRKAKALKPDIPQLDLNLGLALFKSGNFVEAADIFQSELKQQTDVPRLTILVALSNYGAHHYAAAIPYLQQAAAMDKSSLPLRLALAHCYLWTRQFDQTLAVYQEILAINPDSSEADMIAGEALDAKGDSTGAIEQFRAAVQANPKEPNAHFGLAYLYWTQKRFDEAVPEFQAELANDPDNNQAMIYLGDTYVQQSNFARARQALQQASHYSTNDPLLHLDLGIVQAESGNQEAAELELTKTIDLDPGNVNAHFRLAKLYQSEGKRDQASKEFTAASALNKKSNDSLLDRINSAGSKPIQEHQ